MGDEDDTRAPRVRAVEIVQDISGLSPATEGFLRRHRHRVKTVFADARRTETYIVDFAGRVSTHRDAIALAVYAKKSPITESKLLLRRQVRYAAYLATGQVLTTEMIAGIIERDEPYDEAAVRELWEEAGVEIEPSRVSHLGPPFFPAPGILTEQIVPLAIELPEEVLDLVPSIEPPGDGTPFEEGAENIVVSLATAQAWLGAEASAATNAGFINDAKSEIIIARLARALETGQL